jgi:hypothetical protein
LARHGQSSDETFAAEVARVRASGALGEAGRLRELFDFLAGRGAETPPASQSEIAEAVFGQTETSIDDATVRVYIHRLRKRLDEHYAERGESAGEGRLTVPAGIYALRLGNHPAEPGETAEGPQGSRTPPPRPALAALALALLVAAFLAGRLLAPDGAPPVNAFWQPFLESDRPTLVVVGDYYMFGEFDPVRPEQSRLIRDFRIDSATDLLSLQEAEPGRYGTAEDVGLTYLPLSTAYALRHIVPVLARDGRHVRILAASSLDADTARDSDIVYVGLIGAMALLEDTVFDGSGFAIGETYDELIDTVSRRSYISEEARRLASPAFYRDYGYIGRFRSPGGSLVAVVAGARETALRGVAPIMAGAQLPEELANLAGGERELEALFQVTGQQGADLSERLIVARARPDAESVAR